jgi:deoxycytidine triphosphate deaminase
MAVLAYAGYIPEEAVDVRGQRPERVMLTPEERLLLQTGEVIYTERRMSSLTGRDTNNIKRGVYFMKHAMAQGFDHLKQSQLDEFVATDDPHRRLQLGMFIVNQAFLRAVEPIEDLYRVAHKHGYIHPGERRHPVGILEKVTKGYQPDYFDEIARRIVTAA